MNVLGNAIARYLSKLHGLYSVELPEALAAEMAAIVSAANAIQPNRGLLVADEPTPVASTTWRELLGWRSTDDRIFVWRRGSREPDTSFRSVVRPFISSRFPGTAGGECTAELLVRLSVAELWEGRGRQANGPSFEEFHRAATWVFGVLRLTFEAAGSTPSVHWSDRLLEHWAGMLNAIDAGLATLGVPPDPRHAWEVVRVSGLPLPAKLAGNAFHVAPKWLEERDWNDVARLWSDIVEQFVQPEGAMALLLTALDHEVVGAASTSPWRGLPWPLASNMPLGTPAPVVGRTVFTASASPTMLSAAYPQYPPPVPSWWGVSTADLDAARRRLREQTPLVPDDVGTGLLRASSGVSPAYVLNTRHGTVTHSHTAKRWRARVTVGDVRLRFKEEWGVLYVTPLEPQGADEGDAWIDPDLLAVEAKGTGFDTESKSASHQAGEQLRIDLVLVVDYAATRDQQAGTLRGAWSTARTLRVRLRVRRWISGAWDAGRELESDVDLVVPSPFQPTVLVFETDELVGAAPDNQVDFESGVAQGGAWLPDSTPTITLEEEGSYGVRVYDGRLAAGAPQFAAMCQPAVGSSNFANPASGLFPAVSADLDDGVLVTDASGIGAGDLAVFTVRRRSQNLSSGILAVARGQRAGRKEPSGEAKDSLLGQYQGGVTKALCELSPNIPNSLYQYVLASSEEKVSWPVHPGGPAPLFLFDPPAGALPGIGAGPGAAISQSPEWAAFMHAMHGVCTALGFVPGREGAWLSGLDFSVIGAAKVRGYLDAHRRLVAVARSSGAAADVFWASYPFCVIVVDGRPGVHLGELQAVLLSPLHPARLAWTFAVTKVAHESKADSTLLQMVEGWNIPCTGTTINPAGQRRHMVAVPTDPGTEFDFLTWSALAVVSDSGLAELPVFAAGRSLPWGGRTGLNAKVVERAIKDYLAVHPHINTLELDVRSVSPAPRAHEIDEALLGFVGAEGLREVEELGGAARVWDSEYRHGAMPTRDKLFNARGNTDRSRPFEWQTYPVATPPAEADLALVENASVHLAVLPGDATGVMGLLPLRRFSPAVLTQLRLDQHFAAPPGEDLLGLAALLELVESPDVPNPSLRATPQVQALGIGRGARWEVLGTFNLDPALLSSLVAATTQSSERRLLWEWRPSWLPVDRKTTDLARRPYYVVARIPASLLKALQARQALSPAQAEELLRVLGHRGIGLAALNADAGTQESAAAGYFYAVQVFLPPVGQVGPALPERTLGLLPVDPVDSILQALAGRKLARRADLLAVAISVEDSGKVNLCFVPVEVKHHGMPSTPEAIPGPDNVELGRAREQLADTAVLLRDIVAGLGGAASDPAGHYLKRVALATLVDLAFSFAPSQPQAAFRATVLRGLVSGAISLGVGDAALLWFAPGSATKGSGPCVIDPYGPTTVEGTRLHEVFVDPTTVPGLWWNGVSSGANEPVVRAAVNGAIEACFASCGVSAGSGVAAPDSLLRSMLGMPEKDEGDTTQAAPADVPPPNDGPAPAQTAAAASPQQSVPPAKGTSSASPTLNAAQASEPPAAKATKAAPADDANHGHVADAPAPRAIVGWDAADARWAAVGKLAAGDETVALDLDHPKTVGVFGYMGSGKSYLLGNLIEAAVEPLPGINRLPAPLAVVVFNYRRNSADRFEMSSLAVPNPATADAERLSSEYGASPAHVRDIHVLCLPGELRAPRQAEYGLLGATELYFDPASLGAEDWELLMGEPGSDAVFARTIRNTLVDLRAAGDITLENLEEQVTTRLTGQSRTAARLRFDFVRRYISRDKGVDFNKLLRAGRVLVVDLRQPLFNKDDALRFFLVCANHISRVQGRFNKMVVFDEAHEYMSEAFGERMESRIRLMRHEGTSYVFATQDVASIPMGISRFLTTRFVFDLGTRENVQDLERAAPEFSGYQLTGIKAGHCFVQANVSAQNLFQRPREIRVRPRVTQHGGASRIYSAGEGKSET